MQIAAHRLEPNCYGHPLHPLRPVGHPSQLLSILSCTVEKMTPARFPLPLVYGVGTKLQKHSQLNHPALKLGTTHTPLRARAPTTHHSRRAPQYMKHCLTHVHTTVHLHPPFIYHPPSRSFFLPFLYAVVRYMHKDTCTITRCCFLSKSQTYIVARAWPYHKSFGAPKAGVRAAGG